MVQSSKISVPLRQRGMTLLVGLILLVMLTVIGLVGFRNVTMTERMSGNSADRNVSFQSAESSGKEALELIDSACKANPTNEQCGLTGTPGFYAVLFTQGYETAFWTGVPPTPSSCAVASSPFNWADCAATLPFAYARNREAAQYVIEWLSADVTSTPPVWRFRVTTRSTGGSGGAEVILQTVYTQDNH